LNVVTWFLIRGDDLFLRYVYIVNKRILARTADC